MKSVNALRFSILLFATFGFFAHSAQGQDLFPEDAVIWTLGDSRVRGLRPEHESYRYYLWQNLIRDGRTFDLIGTNFDDGDYSDFRGFQFDRSHDGYGGIRTDQMLGRMDEFFAALPAADIALLGVGGNDLVEGFGHQHALTNLNGVIEAILVDSPNTTIFVEQIAPGRLADVGQGLLDEMDLFNSGVLQIAAQYDPSKVIAVDMSTGWQDSWFADPVHYNEAGAQEVANRYTAAINQRFQSIPEPTTSAACGLVVILFFSKRRRNYLNSNDFSFDLDGTMT